MEGTQWKEPNGRNQCATSAPPEIDEGSAPILVDSDPVDVSMRAWPPQEPSQKNPVAHLLWRIEMVNESRFSKRETGRACKIASELLEVATEEEIVAAYLHHRRESNKRGKIYQFSYLPKDLSGTLALVRKSSNHTPLQALKERQEQNLQRILRIRGEMQESQ